MRWSIRNQILLPFALIQAFAMMALSILLALRGMHAAEEDARLRLDAVVRTLGQAHFPLHATILEQMKGLSAADFVTADSHGQLIATTLNAELAADLLQQTEVPEQEAFTGPISQFVPVTVQNHRFLVGHANILKSSNADELLVLVPEQQWKAVSQASMWPPLFTGGVALLVMVSVSVVISARFASRIRRMQGHVQRIAEGHFEQSIPESGADELGDLASSIRQMAGDLQSLTQQIRTQERASLVTQVAGGLAHQLRNSITGAKMAVQLHNRRCRDNDQESLQVALRQLSLTESQIRGLLTLTRDLQQPPHSGELNQVIERVQTLVTPECEHLQIHLDVRTTAEPLQMRDAEQLEAGLLNVVRNAMEAAGPHGSVQIRSDELDGLVRVDVLNDGPKIDEQLAARMFDAFVTSKPEGVGLGLTLAARTAEAHGGQLTHERLGSQTRFRFEFPRVSGIAAKHST